MKDYNRKISVHLSDEEIEGYKKEKAAFEKAREELEKAIREGEYEKEYKTYRVTESYYVTTCKLLAKNLIDAIEKGEQ